MYNHDKTDNSVIMLFNLAGVAASYILLALSLYKSTEVHWPPKGSGASAFCC